VSEDQERHRDGGGPRVGGRRSFHVARGAAIWPFRVGATCLRPQVVVVTGVRGRSHRGWAAVVRCDLELGVSISPARIAAGHSPRWAWWHPGGRGPGAWAIVGSLRHRMVGGSCRRVLRRLLRRPMAYHDVAVGVPWSAAAGISARMQRARSRCRRSRGPLRLRSRGGSPWAAAEVIWSKLADAVAAGRDHRGGVVGGHVFPFVADDP